MKRKVILGAGLALLLFVLIVLAINRPPDNTPATGSTQQSASLDTGSEQVPASEPVPAASAETNATAPPPQKVDTSQLNDVDASLNDDLDGEVDSSL